MKSSLLCISKITELKETKIVSYVELTSKFEKTAEYYHLKGCVLENEVKRVLSLSVLREDHAFFLFTRQQKTCRELIF